MLTDPMDRPKTTPELFITAVLQFEVCQRAEFERSTVVTPSLKVPISLNGRVVPTAIVGFVGVSCNDVTVIAVTVKVVVPVMPFNLAEICTVLLVLLFVRNKPLREIVA